MDFCHPRKAFSVDKKIAEQDIVFQINIEREPRQGIFTRLIQLIEHHKHINIRLGVEVAAHFGTVENNVLHVIAKLFAQARQVLGERLLFAPSQILETIPFHYFPSSALRAMMSR